MATAAASLLRCMHGQVMTIPNLCPTTASSAISPPLPSKQKHPPNRETEVTPDILEELLSDLAPRYRPQDYNLLFHNCNTFSNELVQLLTGESLPVSSESCVS